MGTLPQNIFIFNDFIILRERCFTSKTVIIDQQEKIDVLEISMSQKKVSIKKGMYQHIDLNYRLNSCEYGQLVGSVEYSTTEEGFRLMK